MRFSGIIVLFCSCLAGSSPALALSVCLEGSYPPFGYIAPDGTVQG
jgi:hypothetical protein